MVSGAAKRANRCAASSRSMPSRSPTRHCTRSPTRTTSSARPCATHATSSASIPTSPIPCSREANMTTEVQLPELGENIEEAEVLKVLVAEGDEIQEGQDVVELETDKATVGLPSPAAGRVKQIAVKQGDHVHVGATVLTLEGGAAEPAREAPSPRQKSPPPADTRERTAAPSTQTARGEQRREVESKREPEAPREPEA